MNNKPKAYLMVGIPGSGKSTWIKNNLPSDIPVISRDIIRHKLGFTDSVEHKAVLSKDKENTVTEYENGLIHRYLSMGLDIVIDDINTGKYRKKMIQFLRDNGAEVIGVRMNTVLETCIKRREGQISYEVMSSISSKLIPLADDEVDSVIDAVGE